MIEGVVGGKQRGKTTEYRNGGIDAVPPRDGQERDLRLFRKRNAANGAEQKKDAEKQHGAGEKSGKGQFFLDAIP